MASQRVTIFAIGGKLADAIWNKAERWSSQRSCSDPSEWAPEQWPAKTTAEVNAFAVCLLNAAFTPPVLYRSQHVALWSRGDLFQNAMGATPNLQLLTVQYEVYLWRVSAEDSVQRNVNDSDEYRWLEQHLTEALTAWADFSPGRVIVLVREILGGLWQDQDVANSLNQIPAWWNEC
ncbi:hypothetical protein DTL42_16530 [Bremerella cremea]|uniref:Uncharacterized protein n=1 Tax=Bremerella cremea TaxID=1031537 RepID=A0A368KNS0_9BACT|nr:hypothetical protein [Bremerella cremea]RCS46092.1 hypothetical protein DTL42_16530 [Bremerella cremea]